MAIERIETDTLIRLVISGPVEMHSIRELRDAFNRIHDEPGKDVELDMGDVQYVDSSGIGQLIMLYKTQKDKDKTLKIINPTPRVLSLLQLSSLADILE